jgi:hypothetical protein
VKFIVGTLIYFELMFVKGIQFLSRFLFLFHVNIQLSQHYLLKRSSFALYCPCSFAYL